MYKVGFTCGAFDLLHPGHIRMFKECKEVCKYLVVGIQSDPSIDRQYKNKPIQTWNERVEMVSSIRYVDKVIKYTTEASLYLLLKNLKPDVRIIGEDWKGKKFTGYDLPIKIYYNKRKHNLSSTELKERIYNYYLKKMAKAKLGSGIRFKSLTKKLSAKGASNPKALAAWIGRKKYGSKKMASLSAKGRRK